MPIHPSDDDMFAMVEMHYSNDEYKKGEFIILYYAYRNALSTAKTV